MRYALGVAAAQMIELDSVVTDGWLERLEAEPRSGVSALGDAFGRSWAALCLVAGLRVRTVSVDTRHRELSVVSFSLGDEDELHEMPLGELRRRLAATLRDQVELTPFPLPKAPDSETVQAFLGIRNLLLAPIFGIRLSTLEIDAESAAWVHFFADGQKSRVSLQAFFGRLHRELVELERQARQSTSLSLDLEIVEQAEALAADVRWSEVRSLLIPWANTASFILRSSGEVELPKGTAERFGDGMRLLAAGFSAHAEYERAIEVLRVGAQFLRGSVAASSLFFELGKLQVCSGLHDAAIGYYRRALALGAPKAEVLPALAESFIQSKRYVAAACCLEEAESAELSANLTDLWAQVHAHLGDAWQAFEADFPAVDVTSQTLCPPAPSVQPT